MIRFFGVVFSRKGKLLCSLFSNFPISKNSAQSHTSYRTSSLSLSLVQHQNEFPEMKPYQKLLKVEKLWRIFFNLILNFQQSEHFFFLSFAMSFSLSTSFRQINYENGANISQTRQKIQRENRSFFLSSCRGVCALNLFSIFSYEFRTFVTLNDWFIEWIWSLLWNTARLFLINSCTHKFKSCEPVCRPDGFILYFHSIRSVHSLLSTLHLLVIVYNVTFVKSNTFVSMIIALTFSCQIIRQKSLTISSVGPCVTI